MYLVTVNVHPFYYLIINVVHWPPQFSLAHSAARKVGPQPELAPKVLHSTFYWHSFTKISKHVLTTKKIAVYEKFSSLGIQYYFFMFHNLKSKN